MARMGHWQGFVGSERKREYLVCCVCDNRE